MRGRQAPGAEVWPRQKGERGLLVFFMIFRRGADKGAAESANVASALCEGVADWAEPGLGGQSHACPCRGEVANCQPWMRLRGRVKHMAGAERRDVLLVPPLQAMRESVA